MKTVLENDTEKDGETRMESIEAMVAEMRGDCRKRNERVTEAFRASATREEALKKLETLAVEDGYADHFYRDYAKFCSFPDGP